MARRCSIMGRGPLSGNHVSQTISQAGAETQFEEQAHLRSRTRSLCAYQTFSPRTANGEQKRSFTVSQRSRSFSGGSCVIVKN